MNYVERYYKVPARRGQRVRYTPYQGKPVEGVITRVPDQYIWIRFDGDKKASGPFHPTDGIEYLQGAQS